MKLTMTFTLAALCVAGFVDTSHAAGIFDDGNFSNATTGSLTSNSAWQLIANMPDGTNRAAQFQTGFANAQNTAVGGTEAPGTGAGIWFRSFEGNQGGSGEALAQGVVTQSVVAPSDGDYTISFVAGREVNFMADAFFVTATSNFQSSTIDLLSAVIPDGNIGGGASPNGGGTPFSITLPGITAGEVLSVTGAMINGRDSQIPGGQSAFLDSFCLTVVPEPVSASLLGLGMIGLLGLRRRR